MTSPRPSVRSIRPHTTGNSNGGNGGNGGNSGNSDVNDDFCDSYDDRDDRISDCEDGRCKGGRGGGNLSPEPSRSFWLWWICCSCCGRGLGRARAGNALGLVMAVLAGLVNGNALTPFLL